MAYYKELEHRIGTWLIHHRLQGKDYHKVKTACDSCGIEKIQILHNMRKSPTACKSCGAGDKTPLSRQLNLWYVCSIEPPIHWVLRGQTLETAMGRLSAEKRALMLEHNIAATKLVVGICPPPMQLNMESLRERWATPPAPPEPPAQEQTPEALQPTEKVVQQFTQSLPDDIDQQDLPPNTIKVRPKFLPFVVDGQPMHVPLYIKEFLATLGDTRLMEVEVNSINEDETLVSFHKRQMKQIVTSFDLD